MRRLVGILTLIIYFSCCLTAQERTDSVPPSDGGDLIVSIVTCEPGPDVYELCGHTALRIRNERMDSVWNYGIFDFTSPNFIYRFCKGETDYMVYGYDFRWFMPVYEKRGSKVSEQVLDLTQEEAWRLKEMVETESLPENRVYRYNYVRDNCATRPWRRVNEAVQGISLPDTLYHATFRDEMKHFHRNYPWYQFGIDLALGSGLDYPMAKDEDIFAPPVLESKLAGAEKDGRPLVKETNVIFPGRGDVTLPPTPWYMTPMAVGIAMLIISFGAFFAFILKGKVWRLWISCYFIVAGIAGCVITFLVLFSEHEATSPNVLILWLNPLQLLIGLGVWWKKWWKIVLIIAVCDILVTLGLTVLWFTPLIKQMFNPAVWPMLLCQLPLGCMLVFSAFSGRLYFKSNKEKYMVHRN